MLLLEGNAFDCNYWYVFEHMFILVCVWQREGVFVYECVSLCMCLLMSHLPSRCCHSKCPSLLYHTGCVQTPSIPSLLMPILSLFPYWEPMGTCLPEPCQTLQSCATQHRADGELAVCGVRMGWLQSNRLLITTPDYIWPFDTTVGFTGLALARLCPYFSSASSSDYTSSLFLFFLPFLHLLFLGTFSFLFHCPLVLFPSFLPHFSLL